VAENRVTQVAVESLVGPGVANARVTQCAVETLVGPGVANARVTQAAVETLVLIGGPAPAADVRQTQEPLEHADFPQNDVRETQAALEHIGYPPNEVWETQACLEVVLPADGFAFNHGYTGLGNNSFGGTVDRGNFGYTA
jgi:hypothetical protein